MLRICNILPSYSYLCRKHVKNLTYYVSSECRFGYPTSRNPISIVPDLFLESDQGLWIKSIFFRTRSMLFYMITYPCMIRKAIVARIARSIECLTLRSLVVSINKLLFLSWVFLLMFVPDMVHSYVFHQDGMILSGYVLLNVYVFFDLIVSYMCKLYRKLPAIKFTEYIPKKKIHNSDTMIDSIDRGRLVEFLFKHQWFPYVAAKSRLWLFPKDYKKIWDNLERIGILVRGENNARILKSGISSELLQQVISKNDSDDLSLPLLQEWSSMNFQKI